MTKTKDAYFGPSVWNPEAPQYIIDGLNFYTTTGVMHYLRDNCGFSREESNAYITILHEEKKERDEANRLRKGR